MELIEQFGPALGGALLTISALVAVVKILDARASTMASKLEAQYEARLAEKDRRIAALEAETEWLQRLALRATDGWDGTVKMLSEGPRRG